MLILSVCTYLFIYLPTTYVTAYLCRYSSLYLVISTLQYLFAYVFVYGYYCLFVVPSCRCVCACVPKPLHVRTVRVHSTMTQDHETSPKRQL